MLNNFTLKTCLISHLIIRYNSFAFSVIMKPPYEVTETGWGEFEVVIKIYFHDPAERPVSLCQGQTSD